MRAKIFTKEANTTLLKKFFQATTISVSSKICPYLNPNFLKFKGGVKKSNKEFPLHLNKSNRLN